MVTPAPFPFILILQLCFSSSRRGLPIYDQLAVVTYQAVNVRKHKQSYSSHEGGNPHRLERKNIVSGYYLSLTHGYADLGPNHGGHQLPGVDIDHGEGEGDVELPDHGEADCPPGVSFDWDKHAGDTGESSYHHCAEQDPPPTPLIHKVPPDEIWWNLHSGTESNIIWRFNSVFDSHCLW